MNRESTPPARLHLGWPVKVGSYTLRNSSGGTEQRREKAQVVPIFAFWDYETGWGYWALLNENTVYIREPDASPLVLPVFLRLEKRLWELSEYFGDGRIEYARALREAARKCIQDWTRVSAILKDEPPANGEEEEFFCIERELHIAYALCALGKAAMDGRNAQTAFVMALESVPKPM